MYLRVCFHAQSSLHPACALVFNFYSPFTSQPPAAVPINESLILLLVSVYMSSCEHCWVLVLLLVQVILISVSILVSDGCVGNDKLAL